MLLTWVPSQNVRAGRTQKWGFLQRLNEPFMTSVKISTWRVKVTSGGTATPCSICVCFFIFIIWPQNKSNVIHSVEQSPSCEANSRPARQEIPRLFTEPSPCSQNSDSPYLGPVKSTPQDCKYSCKLYFDISSHLLLGLPSDLFPSHLPNKFA